MQNLVEFVTRQVPNRLSSAIAARSSSTTRSGSVLPRCCCTYSASARTT
nr:hypothetical protein [Klebsiella pneumoniae subsp. pneumoniae]